MAWTVSSDAYVGLKRIGTLLLAEDLPSQLLIDPDQDLAISAHGSFVWETVEGGSGVMGGKGAGGQGRGGRDYEAIKKKKAEEAKQKKEDKQRKKTGLPKLDRSGKVDDKDKKAPFSLKDIDFNVKRGSLVCIVGSVGSGKVCSSLFLMDEARGPGPCRVRD